jgi:predicted anti-sigma-YlaC factor YlaD
MNFCPESEKIRALRSGSLSAEETRRFQSHLEDCPACRQELQVESAIDRELVFEYQPPEIESPVLRELKLLGLAEAEGNRHDYYKYLISALLITVLGILVTPYLLHLPPLQIGSFFSPDRIRPLVNIFKSNPLITIGIGYALLGASLVFSFPRLRRVF